MANKCFLILAICIIIITISCDIADLINSEDVDCEQLCSKKIECNTNSRDIEVCREDCNTLIKYGYFSKESGKKINGCLSKSCSEYQDCLYKLDCDEPDYGKYVNARCSKFESCGEAIFETVCIITGDETIKSDIKNTLIKCATDKLFDDITDCIKKLSCDLLEYNIEICLKYYESIKSL